MAVRFDIGSRIVVSKDQVSSELGGEAVILSLINGVYYGLDPVGARIWQLVQEPVTLEQIRDVLRAEYNVEAAELRVDIRELLEQLAEHGLIENAE